MLIAIQIIKILCIALGLIFSAAAMYLLSKGPHYRESFPVVAGFSVGFVGLYYLLSWFW